MQKFEYKCVAILGAGRATTEVLNRHGEEGWELVTVWFIWHYFKRPLID
jgi:hypothetical protein